MGLNRYAQGIIRHAPSGTELVKLVTFHHEHVSSVCVCVLCCVVCSMCLVSSLVILSLQLAGITHPLHKKKLKFAVRVS